MRSQPNTSDPRQQGPKPPFPAQQQDSPGSEAQMQPAPDYGEASYQGHGRLRDRVAVVTGGDSGIGRAVALAYAREGADVVVAYLDEHQDAERSCDAVRQAGRRALAVAADLGEEAGCRRVSDAAVQAFGRIDVLVNNAAYQGKSADDFEALDYERVAHTFKVNIVSMFALCRLALPHMQPGGSIINVGSIQAYKPTPGILDYAATKGAIVAFTKGLSQQLASERGIRVNCVAPGPVWTPLIVQSFDADKVKSFGKQSPLQRPAQPKELAPAFVFLASDEGRFVNGEVLGVTGGGLLA